MFGAAFVILFLVFAIVEGLGDPGVPSGDAALVEDVPGDIGKISEQDVAHAIEIAAAQAGEKKPPKQGTPKYEELKEAAMQQVLEAVWIQGIADEWGIEVTDAEVAKELKKVKSESFKSKKEYREFLDESGYTAADIDERVMIQILSTRLQQELQERAPTPTSNQVKAYYEETKATQFTQQPSRDIRLIVNKDRQKAKEAYAALRKDNTAKNWKAVAKKYSEDPATKASGGLQPSVQEGVLEEPLNKDVFKADEGSLEGPIKAQRGFTVFEVVSETPEETQSLQEVGPQIESTLTQEFQQEYFASFVSTFNAQWTGRTFCAPDYTIERCANFEGGGRPATAPEACYEADPKTPPEACPAPVNQLVPARPGSVSPLAPKGEQQPQRPQPTQGAGEEAGTGLEGLPGGVPPTAGAPPPAGSE